MKRKFVAVTLAFVLCCGMAVTAGADETGAADNADPVSPSVEQQAEAGETTGDQTAEAKGAAEEQTAGAGNTATDPAAGTGETGGELPAGNSVAGTDDLSQTAGAGEVAGQADTEPYAGVLNQGFVPERVQQYITVNPVKLSDLTPAQQNTMKPLYEALDGVDLTGGQAAAWVQEKLILESFLKELTGQDLSTNQVIFGKIANMEYKAYGVPFINYGYPDFVAIQLKEDGTWQDVDAEWGGAMNDIYFSDISLEEPIFISFIDVEPGSRGDINSSFENYLKQIYIKKIVVNDLTSSLDSMTTQQQKVVSGIQTRLEESNYSNQTESEQLSTVLQIFSDLIKEQTGTVVSKLDRWGCLDIDNKGNIDLSGGYPVEFPAPGIAAGDQVVVLHLKADGTWEKIQATAGNGTITGIFTSLSPVYYFKGTFAPAASTETGTSPAPAASAVHEHSWQTNVIEPTVDTWGYTMYGCNECGYSYADHYVAPLGQNAAGRSVSPKTSESMLPYLLIPALCAVFGGTVLTVRRRHA